MTDVETIPLAPGRKAYFASDFHLGTPSPEQSLIRERAIVAWLDTIRHDAGVIFLVGDLFEFWFEYRRTIPRGFTRFQGKLAELADAGTRIVIFTGNHDMWMYDYFTKEMGIPVYREPRQFDIGGKRFLIGHGDGLGPNDFMYKQLKKVFENRLARWLFSWIHPDLGIGIAYAWSQQSRASHMGDEDEQFLGEDREWLMIYSREIEAKTHHDYYIFGHRHLPMDLNVSPTSRYVNLGEWMVAKTYAVFDGAKLELKTWTPGTY